MGRIQGLSESGLLLQDTQLKDSKGYVFSITIGFAGITLGEHLTLRDSSNGLASGHNEVAFAYSTANGTIVKEWANGKEFDNGIFLNIGPTAGQVWVSITYK